MTLTLSPPSRGPGAAPVLAEPVLLGGLRFERPDRATLALAVRTTLERGTHHRVASCGVRSLIRSLRDDRLRATLDASHVLYPEGSLLAALVRLAEPGGDASPSSLRLVDALVAAAIEHQAPVFLLGGRGDQAFDATLRLRDDHPRLRIAGADAVGPSADGRRAAQLLRERIQESGARIVICAPTTPFLVRFAEQAPPHLSGVVFATLWDGLASVTGCPLERLPLTATPRLLRLFGAAISQRFRTRSAR